MAESSTAVFLAAGADTVQRCARCGATFDERHSASACARCGGLLDVIHARPSVVAPDGSDARLLAATFAQHCCARPSGHASGVWRFQSLVMPSVGHAIISHPEGNTPLLSRDALSRWCGVDGLQIKHEGHNPTGSFKDRGMTVGVTQAARIGARAVACASTGNTSASLAAYAAQAGIPGLVFVPEGKVTSSKLVQTLAYGARTLLVRGDFDDCLRLAQESARALHIYLLNSINPWRVEGQKTIVFELLQQLEWRAPDFLVLPAGNLGNTAAFGKAIREAFALGLISRVPRLVAVQAAGAAPFAASYREHFATRHVVTAETIATAIRIGDPASWDRGVRAIRETDGIVVSCTDDEIVDAKIAIDAAGVGCEPASAASLAGIKRLVADGVMRSHDHVVAILTGHVLKDPGMLVDVHQHRANVVGSNRPLVIDANVDAVARLLDSAHADVGAA